IGGNQTKVLIPLSKPQLIVFSLSKQMMNARSGMGRRLALYALPLLMCLLVGCNTAQKWEGDEPPVTNTSYQPGDKIIIDFADTQGLPPSWPQTVREDGSITLPLNQTV